MRGSHTYPEVMFCVCTAVHAHLISCVVKCATPTMFWMTMPMLLGDSNYNTSPPNNYSLT